MSGKVSLCIIFGLGFFSMNTFGKPSQDAIDEVQRLESGINSGNLDEVDEAEQKVHLLDLAGQNFGSLPENIKGLLDANSSDKTKKLVALNILRLYAFPRDPMEIRTALNNLIYHSDTDIFKNNSQIRNDFLDAIGVLSEDERFREIVTCQARDYR
ncbi:MAG: hypothetical protein LBJ13_01500 [Puniceicoccales bacterium]|jgi:hypothetical protein|nr:hypothetical protein [Puniceicoccales bacterium]